MMRAVLLLLVVLGLVLGSTPIDAERKHRHRRHRDVVVVRDYSPDAWKPYVAETVATFNAMLPKRAPRMRYQAMPDAPCHDSQVRWNLVVCVDPAIAHSVHAAYAVGTLQAGWGVVRLRDRDPSGDPRDPRFILCHEFMHITTGIPDDYTMPQPEGSCVHGWLNAPGPFDVAYAQAAFPRRRHR